MTREATATWWVCIIGAVYSIIVGENQAATTLAAAALVILACGRKP